MIWRSNSPRPALFVADREAGARVLIPHEHGAYGQLLMPLVVAMVVGRPSLAPLSVATLAVAAFLAHEPLLVMLGQRGLRAAREQRAEARHSLMVFGAIALAATLLAAKVLPHRAIVAAATPLGLVLVTGTLVAIGRERTTYGEIVVALTLTSASLPAALAGGASVQAAITVATVFSAVFVSATMCVRAVIAHSMASQGASKGPSRWAAVAVVLAVPMALAASAALGAVHRAAPWAAAPVLIVALALLLRLPSSRHLRAVGWTLIAATAATAVLLIGVLQ